MAIHRGDAQGHRLIKGYCESQTGCEYIDVEPAMLDADGRPSPGLFIPDGEHMTPEGYEIWTRLVRVHLN